MEEKRRKKKLVPHQLKCSLRTAIVFDLEAAECDSNNERKQSK